MPRSRFFRQVSAVTLSTVLSTIASSEEIEILEATIVTASRMEMPLVESPYSADVIDGVEFIEKSYRTLPEALRETPGVMVQKTAHGHGSPFIRGFTGYRNLLLIDGIRLNNSVFREGPNQYWNTVDSFSIDRLEVVRGQGSVLFGSDAIGGTVNVLTQSSDPLSQVEGESYFDGGLLYQWSSAGQSHVGRVETNMGIGARAGLHIGFSLKDYGNVRAAGLGEQPYTGYDEWDVDSKFEYFFLPNVRLTIAYQHVNQDDIWRAHKTVHGVSWRGTEVGSEQRRVLGQRRQLAYAQLEATDMDAWLDRAKFSLSWQNQEEHRDRVRKRGDGRRDVQGFDVNTFGVFAEWEKDSRIGLLTGGASYYRDWVDSFRDNYSSAGRFTGSSIQGPVGDDSSYDLLGIFIQDIIPAGSRTDVHLGGRYTYAAADVGRAEDPVTGRTVEIDDSWSNFSASGRVIHRLSDERVRVFAGVSQGFRAPNLSDLSRFDSARSSEIETPAPGLDPEKFVSYETGARWNGDRLATSLSYFYTSIDDLIVRAPTGRIVDGSSEVTKRNGGDGYVQGIEWEGRIELMPRLSLTGNVTWQEGEVDTFPTSAPVRRREPLSRIMPTTGFAGVRFDATDDLWVELFGHFSGDADRLNTRDRGDTQRIPPGGTPGYATVGVRGGWQATDRFRINASVENISDEEYRVHGSGQNEPGVNFILTGTLAF